MVPDVDIEVDVDRAGDMDTIMDVDMDTEVYDDVAIITTHLFMG
jgi:hypothetical protein